MSSLASKIGPATFVVWGVIAVGIFAAFQLGNSVGEGETSEIFMYLGLLLGIITVLTARGFWWIPLFIVGGLGFSTTAPGFKIQGVDLMAGFAFACLIAMLSMGQLNAKKTSRNLGVFYFLTLMYVGLHAMIYGMENYFWGDTQFKNIAKAYYGALTPLVIIGLMDRFASIEGLKPATKWLVFLGVFCSLIALGLLFTGHSIPVISGGIMDFSWSSADGSVGYLRWVILPVMMIAVCMTDSSTGFQKIFYVIASVILLGATAFGGGRISMVIIALFFLSWIGIRRRWRQMIIAGWLLLIGSGGLFLIGHSIDVRRLQEMPEALHNVQRALSIFLPKEARDESQLLVELSNQWHEDLVKEAWSYSKMDTRSLLFGHGFQGWDDSIDIRKFTYGAAYDSAVTMAVKMGASETLFFSMLPIFGWVGVLLYYGFMIQMMMRAKRLIKLCPEKSMARSLCGFSFCNILVTVMVSPIGGAIPAYGMVYWMLGFIAAEPYISKAVQGKSSMQEATSAPQELAFEESPLRG